jgi:hypothetical protein
MRIRCELIAHHYFLLIHFDSALFCHQDTARILMKMAQQAHESNIAKYYEVSMDGESKIALLSGQQSNRASFPFR